MGMFTSIIHPKDGRELQIKAGNDACETYHVGDKVSFLINKDTYLSGGLFDGVYGSTSSKPGRDDWVIIKNHKIIKVCSHRFTYKYLIKKYKIKSPKRSLWPKEVYDRYVKIQKKLEKEDKKFEASIKHLSPRDKLGAYMGRSIRDMMSRQGIARRVLKLATL